MCGSTLNRSGIQVCHGTSEAGDEADVYFVGIFKGTVFFAEGREQMQREALALLGWLRQRPWEPGFLPVVGCGGPFQVADWI